MDKNRLVNKVLTDKSDTIAWFVFSLSGKIVACNRYGAILFKFKFQQDLIGRDFREFVPKEIASYLPDQISYELLTNGIFLKHINRCKDDTLIKTLVKRTFIELDGERYIESLVIHDVSDEQNMEILLYRHQYEILKCEVERLKNTKNPVRLMSYFKNDLAKEIMNKHRELSMRDIIYCSLLLAGMQTKEIADVLCISVDSAYKYRKRLRKKMMLSADKDLLTYLNEMLIVG